jgi:RNA polymerase sigma-70 factor (ECF subfamily)
MPEEPAFRDLVRRVRAGDAQATAELVRRYEPAIRLAVRARLTDRALRRRLDSMDICQSVLASFFVRAAAGKYELDQPGQLLRLLVAMARNKLINQAKKQRAARRDYRRQQPPDGGDAEPAAPGPSPSDVVAHRELLQEFRSRLSAAEQQLADRRAAGRRWTEIAAEVGGQPDTLRVQLNRAIDRVTRELGLED